MKETPQPKLRVGRGEADEKIQAQIEKGQLLRDRQISNDESDNAIRECEKWSKYNEHLLFQLFDNDSIAEDEYVDFYYDRHLSVDPNWTPPWNLSSYQEGMDKSLNSLEGIRERLELFDEPSDTFQLKPPPRRRENGGQIMNETTQPKLLVSREEANKKIKPRIEEGQRLRKQSIDSFPEMHKAREDYESWSKDNVSLLSILFDTSSVADKYKHLYKTERMLSTAGSSPEYRNLSAELDSYTEVMDEHIYQLRSICDNLEQYQTLDTLQHTFDNKEVSDNPPRTSGNDVFIVHGRDNEAKETVARFVEQFGIEATILHEKPSSGLTIIEKIEKYSDDAGFAIVLITPDDVGALKDEADEESNPRARQNVIFELGYFMGKLGRDRVCPLFKGEVEKPSDIDGVVYVPMDSADGWQLKLATEMKQAGLPVDLNKLA